MANATTQDQYYGRTVVESDRGRITIGHATEGV